ncbi:hypothetical protein AQS8620_02667 [Aquimixticola soesokkakensis]|uniref:Uncharacterized protein n=1 Tax=Aquimixticola soesokkakensis TaxID=1519096 RepID=A0A1Y5TDS9_9RHOB|nr:hypothetical protein [Aquimixticola soesokkakensis]SLN59649.1 hypothetical protein AQS8620_02667 [Aquimixticola soesokkakensis]
MTLLFCALLMCGVTVALLRDAVSLPSGGRVETIGFSGRGVIAAFTAFVVVAVFTAPLIGAGVLLAAILHDFGAAFACRKLGHAVARVRILPQPFFGPPRIDRPHARLFDEAYVALFAAAIAVGPMVLCFALFHALSGALPQVATFARAFGIAIGAFNFFLLLPFLPLGGGQVIRAISLSVWPALGVGLTVFMALCFGFAALKEHSLVMLALAVTGFASLIWRSPAPGDRLTSDEVLLVLAAYAFCLATHWLGGWWLLQAML